MLNYLSKVPERARILDAGGWAHPHAEATHVADLYPWETRSGRVQLSSSPAEKFSRSTWYQVNFCDANMRIPVPDKYFDFAVCTQTLEDLRCPNFLMDELSRVAKAGYVEVPSRLAEQTVGMSDRASTFQGYNHHKWIIDFEGQLVFYDKDESLYGPRSLHSVPRRSFEAIVAADSHRQNVEYCWVDRISYRICEAGDVARDKAFAFRASLGISGIDVALDNAIRFSRRVRDTAIGRDPWKAASMRLLSQQYSTLDLS